MAVDRPVCFWCTIRRRPVEDRFISPVDAVFESACGHEGCASQVFHGLCLMEFRDDERVRAIRQHNDALLQAYREWLHGESDI